uniref:Myb/SANT-like domain-containing protein n=1 Tax=Quercus lobata TaxID=97700 RepID=A0A7N2L481_QUELO
MVKEKSKDGGSNDPRADWKDLKELQAFCEFCAVQVIDDKRKGGFLTKTGVDAVIEQLGAKGKVVTHLQIKNKWDLLKKGWKQYNECFDNDTGLGYDAGTGMLEASEEWLTRKIAACPNAKTFKNKPLPNHDFLNIMFRGTVATGKNAFCMSGQIPKETTEGSGDSADDTEFVDPQCEPFVNVDAMEIEGRIEQQRRDQRTLSRVEFPLLFVCMVAITSVVLGYLLHPLTLHKATTLYD